MGEKEEKEKKGNGEKKSDGEKKEEGPAVVEVKLDLHCEGCAHKVKKLVRGLQGVESVNADPATNRLKVTGKVDPWQLKEVLEARTKKKVDFISPKDPPKKSKDEDKKNKAEDGKDKEPKKEEAKPKPPEVTTVVLKIRLHCDGCIHRIKRHINKIKGVEEVTVDAANDLVTVKGTMNVKTLPDVLKAKFKRSVEIVPSKKEEGGGGGEKKGEEKKGGQKDKAGNEKKEDEKKGGDKKEKDEGKKQEAMAAAPPPAAQFAAAATMMPAMAETNRMDYYAPYPYAGYGYRVEMVHAPQMFSDENPNACSIM